MSDTQKMHSQKTVIALVIALVVVGGGAFYGGTAYAKRTAMAGRQAAFGGAGGQNRGGFAAGGAGRNAGGFASGEILSKDDKSITIKSRNGGSQIIYYSDSTKIGKSVEGTSADLILGEQVVVSGKTNTDGTVTAQTVDVRPALPPGAAPSGAKPSNP